MKTMTDLLPAGTGRLTGALHPPDPVRLLFCLALTGFGAGVLLARSYPVLCGERWLMQGLAVSEAERTLWDACKDALIPLLILYCGMLLSGFSAAGQPCTLMLLLSRGASVSVFLVLTLLPALLAVCDRVVIPRKKAENSV